MTLETDFIVVGSGIAGLRAALELAHAGARVTVLTKDRREESNTEYAQGGVAVALSEDDETSLHEEDTLAAGAGLCDERAVEVLVDEGRRYIQELMEWGTEFDREGGRLLFTREAAHSRRRILHAQGDATGREIVRALLARAGAERNISFLAHAETESLVVRDGRVLRRALPRPARARAASSVRARRRARHGRGGRALPAHDQPGRGDRRRDGDGLPRGRRVGGHGVRAVSSDGLERRGRAALPALGGAARRGRRAAQRGGAPLHAALPRARPSWRRATS